VGNNTLLENPKPSSPHFGKGIDAIGEIIGPVGTPEARKLTDRYSKSFSIRYRN
jgi:hypothetical protein